MSTRDEHLKVLGLNPDASWDEITTTYKDLMRVWHPDRFPNDERLQKRAQHQSQLINRAMTELRKLGKEPTTAREPTTTQTAPQQTRSSAGEASHANAHTTASKTHRSSFFTQPETPPSIIRRRPTVAFLHLMLAAIVVCAAYEYLTDFVNRRWYESDDSIHAAFAGALLFYSLRVIAISAVQLVTGHPSIVVDKRGILLAQSRPLGWRDIDQAWPIKTRQVSALNIVFSEQYVRKLNPLRRAILRLRNLQQAPHITIWFNGLEADPTHVVNVMKLRQLHNEWVVEDRPFEISRISTISSAISLATVVIFITHCLADTRLTEVDLCLYGAVFLVFHLIGLIGSLRARGMFSQRN